mmetsp:Transcript_25410/g.55248  ORF Transcript_25410/g.55248 Transcript_25410/m.55248 type:complete len:123 (-) Transcript_25410:766-1134(-)
MPSVPSGEIVFIDEVLQSEVGSWEGHSVRIIGRLKQYDVLSGRAVVHHRESELKVDTILLRGVALTEGSLFQFIGELEKDQEHEEQSLILKARVGRNVEGMDLPLYEQAVVARREYLQAELK